MRRIDQEVFYIVNESSYYDTTFIFLGKFAFYSRIIKLRPFSKSCHTLEFKYEHKQLDGIVNLTKYFNLKQLGNNSLPRDDTVISCTFDRSWRTPFVIFVNS